MLEAMVLHTLLVKLNAESAKRALRTELLQLGLILSCLRRTVRYASWTTDRKTPRTKVPAPIATSPKSKSSRMTETEIENISPKLKSIPNP